MPHDARDLRVAVGAVADQLLAVLAAHEREQHGGRPCPGARILAVSQLAHALGLTAAGWDEAGRVFGAVEGRAKKQLGEGGTAS
jgi:hypothetical protein